MRQRNLGPRQLIGTSQLGHRNLGVTTSYLQGIDSDEIIETVHGRHQPIVRPAPRSSCRPAADGEAHVAAAAGEAASRSPVVEIGHIRRRVAAPRARRTCCPGGRQCARIHRPRDSSEDESAPTGDHERGCAQWTPCAVLLLPPVRRAIVPSPIANKVTGQHLPIQQPWGAVDEEDDDPGPDTHLANHQAMLPAGMRSGRPLLESRSNHHRLHRSAPQGVRSRYLTKRSSATR